MDSKISIEYTCRFNELYDSDKVAIINLINTMASYKGALDFKAGIEELKHKLIVEKLKQRLAEDAEKESDSEEEEEEEEEDDWMDVYHESPIQDFTDSKTFDKFSRNNTFYQTMGGGPTGGLMVDENKKVWVVSVKGWGADWTCEDAECERIEIREENRKNGISKAIRVIWSEDDNNSEDTEYNRLTDYMLSTMDKTFVCEDEDDDNEDSSDEED